MILERKPRKNRLLVPELDPLTFLESLGNTGPRSVGRPDPEGQRVVVGLISWSDNVGPDASHVVDCVHVEVDEDHHEAGHVPCTRLHFGFSSFLGLLCFFLRIWKIQYRFKLKYFLFEVRNKTTLFNMTILQTTIRRILTFIYKIQ